MLTIPTPSPWGSHGSTIELSAKWLMSIGLSTPLLTVPLISLMRMMRWWSLTHLKTMKMIAEKYSARLSSSIQKALEEGELDNVNWAPGPQDPADDLTKVRCDVVPLLRLLESGHCNPGALRPLNWAAWGERADHGKNEN